MSGNDEKLDRYRVNIGPKLRMNAGMPIVCPFCGHFGLIIDVEIISVEEYLITCNFCLKTTKVRIVENER
jgi:transcription elongation factor Elf1